MREMFHQDVAQVSGGYVGIPISMGVSAVGGAIGGILRDQMEQPVIGASVMVLVPVTSAAFASVHLSPGSAVWVYLANFVPSFGAFILDYSD